MTPIRYIRAKGNTLSDIRTHMQDSPLYKIGDCILVWVSEGDFWVNEPVNVEDEAKERAEYERLKLKFG